MTECETEKKYFNRDGKEIKRQSVTTYCRIMGYLRPKNSANIGKKSEMKERVYFTEDNANSSPYVDRTKDETANQEFNKKHRLVMGQYSGS